MTIEEIEKIIDGHYHPAAKKENIIKMWEIIGEQYTIKLDGNTRYIIIDDKIYFQITSQVSKNMFILRLYTSGHSTRIIKQSQWDDLMAKQKAYEQRKKRQEKKQEQAKYTPHGIYCIKYQDEVVYIGMTENSFEKRWKEHLYHFRNPDTNDMLLYHSNLDYEKLEFKVMVDLTKDKADRELTTRDIKAMEMGLIACFKPRYNVAGVKIPYRFS